MPRQRSDGQQGEGGGGDRGAAPCQPACNGQIGSLQTSGHSQLQPHAG